MSHHKTAVAAFERGDYRTALRHFEVALAQDHGKNTATLLGWIGACQCELGQYAEARNALERALFKSSGTPSELLHWWTRAVYKQAVSAFEAKDYRAAADQFRMSLDHGTANEAMLTHTLVWLGISYLMLGEYANALETFEAVLTDSPNERAAKVFVCYILATAPDVALRDGQRAAQIAEELLVTIEQPSDEWQSLTLLAAARAETGEYDRAVPAYEQAMALMPAEEREKRRDTLRELKNHEPIRSSPESDRARLFKRSDYA